MKYQKRKEKYSVDKKWIAFRTASQDLMDRSGLPAMYTEKQEVFDDFLMHGCIDHHDDPIKFSVDEMNLEQRRALLELVCKYYESGFNDPGIMVITHEERKLFPRWFSK